MGSNAKGPERLLVAVCLPGDPDIRIRIIEGNQLEGLKGLVGGWLEKVGSLPYDGNTVIDVYCNEDGLGLKLPSNRLVHIPGRGQMPVVGNIVLSAANPHTGEQVSLDGSMLAAARMAAETWPMAPNPPNPMRIVGRTT